MPRPRRLLPPLPIVERRWQRYLQTHPWVHDVLLQSALELQEYLDQRPRLVRRLRVLARTPRGRR